jgi:hypothetical protein
VAGRKLKPNGQDKQTLLLIADGTQTNMTHELSWPESTLVLACSLFAAWLSDGRLTAGTFLAVGMAAFGVEILMQRKQCS